VDSGAEYWLGPEVIDDCGTGGGGEALGSAGGGGAAGGEEEPQAVTIRATTRAATRAEIRVFIVDSAPAESPASNNK